MRNHDSLPSASKAPFFLFRPSRSQISLCLAAGVAALFSWNAPSAHAETFTSLGGTQNWNVAGNWVEGTVPNGIGAEAIFNTPAGNQSATLAGTAGTGGITIGSLTFNSTGSTTMGIPAGGGGPFTYDAMDAGPATVTTMGSGSGNTTISAASVFTDSVTVFANNTVATAGVTFSGAITGPGGWTKEGDGIATISTANKAYTGATVLNGGRTRISLAGLPVGTSSFTVNTGAQLTLIATDGTYTLGAGFVNLNGTGALSGPHSIFPGAIRNDTGRTITLTNPVVLQSDTLIHVQATAGTGGNPTPTGAFTLSGNVSGPGKLTMTAPNSNNDQGSLILTNINTYTGGTLVNGGILNVNSDAALGAAAGGIELNTMTPGGVPLHAVLRASGNVSTTTRTLTLTNLGGTIDTNGNDVTFGVGSTITDAGLPATLRKTGAGKLTIAGTQTYEILTTTQGRTDLASALGTGTSTINADAPAPTTSNIINIGVSQTLTALNIGDGAVVTLGVPLPPAPSPSDAAAGFDGPDNRSLVSEGGGNLSAGFGQAVPEPGCSVLMLGGLGLLLGMRRRDGV